MDFKKKEPGLSSSLESMLPSSGKDATSIDRFNVINENLLTPIENEGGMSDKQERSSDTSSKKKYKKNLIWDGPRWDLAHFDPSMSARERKKLIYYETLFNKLENDNFLMKCNENTSNINRQIGNRGRKGRNNTVRSIINTRESENKYKCENNGRSDSTNNTENRKIDKYTNNIQCTNNETIEYGVTDSSTPYRSRKSKSCNTASIDNYREHCKSDDYASNTAVEGENSSIRRYHDWRIKLLSKAGSLQMTPLRAQKL
ncbi:hypothetical protein FG379_002230 [Cryptosporidium bovis]|uniref:uncharacterized protein n=1 Tax=Cryptosporidium bovis TaxID=310047 RepID=UPI00351A1DB8|nr:hypothetical protein FG379_002230 [Cryptosporidium bovis]